MRTRQRCWLYNTVHVPKTNDPFKRLILYDVNFSSIQNKKVLWLSGHRSGPDPLKAVSTSQLLRVSTPGLELSDKSTHWHEEQSRDETEIPALMEVTREVRKSTAGNDVLKSPAPPLRNKMR